MESIKKTTTGTRWSDVPDVIKFSSVVIISAFSIAGYFSMKYQTVEAAQQYQAAHKANYEVYRGKHAAELATQLEEQTKRVDSGRIQALEGQIANHRYQLLSANLTEQQKQWLKDEIKRLNGKIDCIQKKTC